MIFGRHINRYYIRYGWVLLLGLCSLIVVDYFQLVIPNLYQMVINGVNHGSVEVDGTTVPFDMNFLLDRICMPMAQVILVVLAGQFLWRLCYVTLSLQGAPIPYRRPVSGRCPAYRLIIPQSHVRRILSAISFRWRLMRTAR